MDQTAAKKTLQELIRREGLQNRTCVDCGNPNPQWASGSRSPHGTTITVSFFFCSQLCHFHLSPVRRDAQRLWRACQVCSVVTSRHCITPLQLCEISLDGYMAERSDQTHASTCPCSRCELSTHTSAHSSGETRPLKNFYSPTGPLIKEDTKMV